MKYQTKDDVIAAAQTAGSTATTWHGAKRWILANVEPRPLDWISGNWREGNWRGPRRSVPTVNAQARMQGHGVDYTAIMTAQYGKDHGNWPAYGGIDLLGRDALRRTRWIERIERRLDSAAQWFGIWSMADAQELAASLTAPYLRHAAIALGRDCSALPARIAGTHKKAAAAKRQTQEFAEQRG